MARHSSDDEFDIDVMADISYRLDVDHEYALATLHDAIRGERGSRYYHKTDRKSRCSTVSYDGMHLDVTPTVRIASTVEKTGLIFHSKPEEPWAKKCLFANPHGFAQWFIAQTPPDQDFGAFFERRSLDYDRARAILTKRADAAPVPEQCPAYQKSRAVIALQLIKRWRNLAYDKRHASRRLPPSVLLAYYVATHANRTKALAEELSFQVETMLAIVGEAHDRGQKVSARNPMCHEDILTDRWPEDLSDQAVFIRELTDFAVSSGGCGARSRSLRCNRSWKTYSARNRRGRQSRITQNAWARTSARPAADSCPGRRQFQPLRRQFGITEQRPVGSFSY